MSRRRPTFPYDQLPRDRNSTGQEYPPISLPRVPSLPILNSPLGRAEYSSMAPSSNRMPARWSSQRAHRGGNHQLDEVSTGSSFTQMINASEQPWSGLSRRPVEDLSMTAYAGSPLDMFERLSEGRSALRDLLEAHQAQRGGVSPYTVAPPYSPPIRPSDTSEDSRRSKRRKVDAAKASNTFSAMRYGQRGQVEPTELCMEMVSCDGGMFSNELSYAAENILKDDTSVYCTKGSRCNIVLRHQGSTVFTLTEIIIKAPGSMNYSHPVREGMVFVSMDQDDMLSRTAQYQIQCSPSRPRTSRNRYSHRHNHNHNHNHGPSEDAQRGPIMSIRHYSDGMTSARARPSHHVFFEDEEEDNEMRTPQMPPEFNASQPDLNVVTECSGDEEEPLAPGGFPLYRRAPAPNRIGVLPFEDDDDDDGDSDDADNATLRSLGSEDGFHRLRRVRANRGTATPLAGDAAVATGSNSISLNEAWDAHARATQDAVRAVGGGDLLAPHARFFIEKKKSKCTIRFDPPVSGRFILLKMWSSRLDPTGNIDIQSVIARGYHGPRYFPSVETR